jgi:hypothetical protein
MGLDNIDDIAASIEDEVLPALADAIVAAEVRGDYGPHVRVQNRLRDIVQRLRDLT